MKEIIKKKNSILSHGKNHLPTHEERQIDFENWKIFEEKEKEREAMTEDL